MRPPPCQPSQLRIRIGPEVSPATGQNPLSIVLTNRSAKPCMVKGYPAIAFVDAHGKRLPFRVSHRGDQMVTSRPPVAVWVRPHRSAFFVLNKYRCDLGNLAVAKKLRVALPGSQTSARLPCDPDLSGDRVLRAEGSWLCRQGLTDRANPQSRARLSVSSPSAPSCSRCNRRARTDPTGRAPDGARRPSEFHIKPLGLPRAARLRRRALRRPRRDDRAPRLGLPTTSSPPGLID
jgi:Protein of unknown function (DUF4232)